jgi:hypothetical protein
VVGNWCALEADGVTPCDCNTTGVRTGTNFYLRITRTNNDYVVAEWGPLRIAWPVIHVARPTGHSPLLFGHLYQVAWTTDGLQGSTRMVELALYNEAGERLFPIGHAPLNEGWFTWQAGRRELPEFSVPAADTGRDVNAGRYHIRVEVMGCASHVAGGSPWFDLVEF